MSTELKKQEEQVPAQATTNYRRPYYRVDGGKDAYTVEVFMPGVSKDDYNVSLHRDELAVEGRKVIPLPTGAKWLHREISPEGYKLRLQLNVDVDPEAIKAKTDNGILTITLPVAKEARPRLIKIS
ncbi:Hsp20/alpha crystallin family protein [Puniceicoccales bacterium CK1056]|uniref:Hsp20/alpha crystallin family protein n=1 Tax=Oceanipulchritudo coccoides TaxID=2706888 RepID=A0A6B2M216_9BACT|nr:Hsp20/alpha crystallin family protein [Oceanipulchritudo coccoides]NDV62978.1 Hsp20/alpha crystallin family protein [Oceanipulchritudo coccoides]